MANKAEKWKDNAGGKFYVDQQCIDCDLCRETAPAFFKRHEEGGYSFVHTQPSTEEDAQLCMEALEGCPVEAIGNDGESKFPPPEFSSRSRSGFIWPMLVKHFVFSV
jgi:ferredoxin